MKHRSRGQQPLGTGLSALFVVSTLAGCAGQPTAPSPGATPAPSASPTPTATPTAPPPTPVPTPEPSPVNRPPTVLLSGGGSCHPSAAGSRLGARSCSVGFRAEAKDPDGDRLEYSWSGCTSGSGTSADCTIATPGPHTAVVTVRDGHGGVAIASAAAQGVNQPPVIRFGSPRPPNPAPANTYYTIVGGQPEDPDQDEEPNTLCRGRLTFTVSGPCTAAVAGCGGVGDVFDVDLTTGSGPGTCTIEAQVRDSWGAVGSDRLSIQVNAVP